jgi:hypothetical protein
MLRLTGVLFSDDAPTLCFRPWRTFAPELSITSSSGEGRPKPVRDALMSEGVKRALDGLFGTG